MCGMYVRKIKDGAFIFFFQRMCRCAIFQCGLFVPLKLRDFRSNTYKVLELHEILQWSKVQIPLGYRELQSTSGMIVNSTSTYTVKCFIPVYSGLHSALGCR